MVKSWLKGSKKVRKFSGARRRRLQPGLATAAVAAGVIGRGIGKRWRAAHAKQTRTTVLRGRRNFQNRLNASDNIVSNSSITIGKQRKLSFAEKVDNIERPPLLFKRHYAFSAEGTAGRKAWFSMEINVFNANDLATDIQTYKTQMVTDTGTTNPNVAGQSAGDNARFYVDKLIEKIRFMNSSSLAMTGKIHLFAHKKDNDNSWNGTVPVTPINMMMFYSANSLATQTAGAGGEGIVGRGWNFDTSTTNYNYNSIYNMPGSSINAAGVTAHSDLILSPMSSHIKQRVGFWFRKVNSRTFSLKPGQQFNQSYIFNDLPEIFREHQEFIHVAGISYSLVVEFEGQIVGDSTVTVGDNIISTGTTQISCLRESTRILGLKNYLRSKIILQTMPLTGIALVNQLIINPDTGILDAGVELDN